MNHLIIGILLFFAGGMGELFVGQKIKGRLFLCGAALAQLFILPTAFSVLLDGQTQSLVVPFPFPIGRALLLMDGLAAFFLLIISLGGLLAAIYSIGYMKMNYKNPVSALGAYYFFLGFLTVSMLLVVLVQNALLFIIVWELMSLASFFLVSFDNDKAKVHRASLYYFIAMQFGAALLIAAFSWASLLTGDMNFASFALLSGIDNSKTVILFLLFFIGFGVKAGFIPMHTWLPLAHPAAPSAVSALMSGIMIKTGIYGILRIILIIGIPAPWLAYLVFGVGWVSGILGVMNAIAQHDLKRLLAYHSIENIGIIGIGIGMGMIGRISGNAFLSLAGFTGAILHVFNHFTFKSLLFYAAGAIYSQTHTRNIEKLGGLQHAMPVTAALFLLASLAICGLPPLNGFISEFAVYIGAAKGLAAAQMATNLASLVCLTGLAFIGIMATICFTKVFGIIFQGNSRTSAEHHPREVSGWFLTPMFVLGGLILVIGLGIPLVLPLVESVVRPFAADPESFVVLQKIYWQATHGLWILTGLILFFILLRFLLLRNRSVSVFKTWDCGYQASDPRLQYTASSFASNFMALVKLAIPQNQKLESPQGYFPTMAGYESHGDDIVERWLVRPLIDFLQRFFNLFSWIQSGRTQQYILYGLIFLIILIIWIIGVR